MKGKFPVTISCRFKGELEGQKQGEWLDKTFLGETTIQSYFFQLSHLVLQIVPDIWKFKCETQTTDKLNFNHDGDYSG